jgi:hypothetical protein
LCAIKLWNCSTVKHLTNQLHGAEFSCKATGFQQNSLSDWQLQEVYDLCKKWFSNPPFQKLGPQHQVSDV